MFCSFACRIRYNVCPITSLNQKEIEWLYQRVKSIILNCVTVWYCFGLYSIPPRFWFEKSLAIPSFQSIFYQYDQGYTKSFGLFIFYLQKTRSYNFYFEKKILRFQFEKKLYLTHTGIDAGADGIIQLCRAHFSFQF